MNGFDNFKKMLNNVGNLGKIIVATGFEWLPNLVTLFATERRTIEMPHPFIKHFVHRKSIEILDSKLIPGVHIDPS